MRKTTLYLVFILWVLLFCIPPLFAVEEDESSWTDFFSFFPSEEPNKANPEKSAVKGGILGKPESLNSEDFSQDIIEVRPQNTFIKENNLADPTLTPGPLGQDKISVQPEKSIVKENQSVGAVPLVSEGLSNDEVEVIPLQSVIKENDLIDPPLAPKVLNKSMVRVPPQGKKEFIDAGDFRDPFLLLRRDGQFTEKVLEPGVTVDGVQFNSYNDSNLFIERVYRDSRFRVKDVFGKTEHLDGGGCLYCHRGIERISSDHKFRCTKCHEGNRRSRTLPAAHKNLVANPSDLDHAPKYCGKCHADQIEKVEQSSMATGKSVINVTRYAWGSQGVGEMSYSLRPKEGSEAFLPSASEGDPVDVFLRTKCMRCHLQSEGPHRPGDYRAGGCAACHMIYSNDGHTLTQDRAIQSKVRKNKEERENRFKRKYAVKSLENSRAYPVMHKFTTAIPSVQCEHCHNANGIGNEFEGLFSLATRPQATFQKLGADKPVLYGAEHEFLLPDIHRERGMHCIDCHVATDLKGTPPGPELHAGVKIRCENCHGTPSVKPEGMLLAESDPRTKQLLASNKLNPNIRNKIIAGDVVLLNSGGAPLTHVKQEKDKWILYSRVTGKKHVIPLLVEKESTVAHRITKHIDFMECHTCHARWSTGEWGMSVIREENPDLTKWKDWNFAEPVLQGILWGQDQLNTGMIDWLTAKWVGNKFLGNTIPGITVDLFSEKDWGTMVLGKNQRGKYSIMKPRHQYFLTDRNSGEGEFQKKMQVPITKDGDPGLILLPHTPHTIRTMGRSCESCHDSQIALGLGDPMRRVITDAKLFFSTLKNEGTVLPDFQAKQLITAAGDPIQQPYPDGQTRFLNEEEILAIQNKSDAYKAFRYMDLRYRRFPRLLVRDEFPYDQLHKKNEKALGKPIEEDILFNMDENNSLVPQRGGPLSLLEKFSNSDSPPKANQENFPKQDQSSNIELPGNEIVMEYSPDIFKPPLLNNELNLDKEIPKDESILNQEGFQ